MILAITSYCDTKSRIYRLFNRDSILCFNPASRRCDPTEAFAHGASMMGMKPSWQCVKVPSGTALKSRGSHAPGSSIRVRG
jgi:hypothetical protein